jgi:hypothetical protein
MSPSFSFEAIEDGLKVFLVYCDKLIKGHLRGPSMAIFGRAKIQTACLKTPARPERVKVGL